MKQEFDSLLTYRRMCKSYEKTSCEGCSFNEDPAYDCEVALWPEEDVEKNMQILRKWHEEHPQLTRLDKFRELFPNHRTHSDGYPLVCVSFFKGDRSCTDEHHNCNNCMEKFWDEVIE